MSRKPYRILSLDGGGSWALIQAKALGAIYGAETDGWSILNRFDYAAANSGGALVLALLLKGQSPGEILALFKSQHERELVFDRNSTVDRALGGLFGFGSRYHAPGKLTGLLDILARPAGRWGAEFAGMTLDRIAAALNIERNRQNVGAFHFLITAFDFDAERSAFFRSDPERGPHAFRHAPTPTIAGALHAATNAPLQYFNRPAEVSFVDGTAINYWDGAVGGYNNPVLAAVVEALAVEHARREKIQVLSIGTAATRLPVVHANWPGEAIYVLRRKRMRGPDGMRIVRDLRKATVAVMSDRPEGATYLAHMMLGEPMPMRAGDVVSETRIVRLNPIIQPHFAGTGDDGHPRWDAHAWFAEASAAKGRTLFERLLALDMDATADAEVQDIERLADLWLAGEVPNQPIHADDLLVPNIGHASFAEALARWRALEAPPAVAPVEAPRPSWIAEAWRRFVSWLAGWRARAPATARVRTADAGGVAGLQKAALPGEGLIVRGMPPRE